MCNPRPYITAHTVTLLRNRPHSLTLADVAEGSKLTKSWLSALLSGQISNPSADKVQDLYEFLSKKPLLPNEEN